MAFGAQVAIADSAGADVTPQGNWWAVDSVSRVNDASLNAVRAWYQGGTPQVWGRYISDISSSFTLNADEIAYAAAHNIYLYLLAADHTDTCGTDSTYDQGVADGQVAINAAQALKIPAGAVLFKDFEERSSRCPSDPSAGFLEGWYAVMKNSNFYKAGFYGNSYSQSNNFAKAYCQAGAAMGGFLAETSIAASEPEPAFNNARGTVGPGNAPAWGPTKPSCALSTATTIWQYGEVGSQAGNIADVDLVLPNAPGLLAPNGTVTGSTAIRTGSTAKNLLANGGFNAGFSGWRTSSGARVAGYASGVQGTNAFEGTGYLATNSFAASGSIYQDVAVNVPTGESYCATLQATTNGYSPGGSGTLAVWLLGGTPENSTLNMANLDGNSRWRAGEVCATATRPHSSVRVQFYPRVSGPTVALDAATLVHDLLRNGGFNAPAVGWTVMTKTNMMAFPSSPNGTVAYEGTGYMATNTTSTTGGIYQDKPMNITKGQTFCASGQFTTQGQGSGAGARYVVWLMGGGGNEQGNVLLTNLPGRSQWTFGQACVTATTNHTTMRVQVYGAVNGPTIAMDAIIVD